MKTNYTFLSFTILLIVVITSYGLNSCKQKEDTREIRARVQPSIPEGWIEQPYIENAPEPVLTEEENQRGFMLFTRAAIEPVYKNTNPLPHERSGLIKAFATPGEFEPLTLSIYPSGDLKNLRVAITDLKCGVHIIDKSNLDLRLVTYWNMHYPWWETQGTYRNVPELLEKVTVNDVKSDESQQYWITVHVPENAPSGIYKGQVNILHDGLEEPFTVPVQFRVLDFKLNKDPLKHFSAYFGGPEEQYRGLTGALYETAVDNELQALLDYGFDIIPTVYADGDGDQVLLSKQKEQLLNRMLEKGFTGPVPVYSGDAIQSMIEKHEGIMYKSHWRIDSLPSDQFYDRVTEAFKEFHEMWTQKGWPEFYLCPIDEVASSAQEFGVKVYKAIKEAGLKTYITKESTDKGADAYSPYVDAWCSQPFDVSYEKAVSGDFEYWSYPNHNSGERKDRPIMLRGGRMTYGFGFWRSGFTVLIPWHWRWLTSDDQFEYLRSHSSPCGMRMDEKGNIIPAIYWESFREGYDDLRYVYTLEQAIENRRGIAECAELVSESELYLKKLWNSIKVQHLYLKSDMWPSEEFNMIRWKMAEYISALSKYPPVANVAAPSVLKSIDISQTSIRYDKETQLEKLMSEGQMEVLDLTENNFVRWENKTGDGSIQMIEDGGTEGNPSLKFTIFVDNEKEEDESIWPNVSIQFERDEIDFPSYDYLYFLVNINSNRDETDSKSTPFDIGFTTFDDKIQTGVELDLGNKQGEWIPFTVSIPELLGASFYDKQYWKELQYINLGISEWRLKYYKQGTELNFNFDKVCLLKYKEPELSEVVIPRYLDITQQWIPIKLIGHGLENAKGKGYKIQLQLVGRDGKNMISKEISLDNGSDIIMDISEIIKTGLFQIKVMVINNEGKVHSEQTKEIEIMDIFEL